jgi:hypothetical protein
MGPTWWRRFVQLARGRANVRGKHRRQKRSPRPPFQPALEQFEDRLVPVTMFIGNPLNAGPYLRGSTIQVPINVDSLEDDNNPGFSPQTGMAGALAVLWYNPAVLTIQNPNTDIQLGTLGNPSIMGDGYSAAQANSWSVMSTLGDGTVSSPGGLPNGQVILNISTVTGQFITGTLGGTLAVINFTVLQNAPLGTSMIDLAQDIPGSTVSTNISDNEDHFGGLQLYALGPNPNSNVADGLATIPEFNPNGPTYNTGVLQTITFGSSFTGGTFTLSENAAGLPSSSAPITYSTVASTLQNNIQNALNSLSSLGATDAVQTITFGNNFATGSIFSLTFNGATTGPITYSGVANTLENNIQNALNSLSTIGPGNSSVALPTTSGGATTVQVTLQNALGGTTVNNMTSNQSAVMIATTTAGAPFSGNTVVNAVNSTSVTVTFSGELGGAQLQNLITTNNSAITVSQNGGPNDVQTYGYYGSDPDDEAIFITGMNVPPVAVNDAYSITERDFSSDPSLTETAATGVLANDTSPIGDPLTASLLTGPLHGTVSLSSNGAFTYTPNTGYLGPDSFTYAATDPQIGAPDTATATVNLTVTARLSIPTNLVGTPGSVALGAVQTLTFGGTISSTSTFTLALNGATTAPITFATGTNSAVVLQNSIQQALNNLSTVGAGNAIVDVPPTPSTGGVSAPAIITFVGGPALAGGAPALVTVNTSSLTGTNPTITVGAAVPVNMDNENPTGSAGLNGVALAIDYDSKVLVLSSATTGTVTSAADEVQTLTFSGTISGGSFQLLFTNASNVASMTPPIPFSSNPATLQSNIQAALSGLTTIGSTGTSPNALVSFIGAGNYTVTFQNNLSSTFFKPMVVVNSTLGGASPNPAVAITTTGQASWSIFFTPPINPNAEPAQLGISESSTGQGQMNTLGGSLVLLVFNVLSTAPGGSSNIYITPQNTPATSVVSTQLTYTVGASANPLQARPSLQQYNTFVPGVDGTITIGGATHFGVLAPGAASAGTPITFTVTAENSNNSLATGYTGTVAFTGSDSQVVFASNNVTLTSGVGTFTATLKTAGSQTLTATDTSTASVFGFSNPILVSASTATHLVVTAPASAPPGISFGFTVTAEDQFNNTAPSYGGTVQFSSSDAGVGAGVPAPSALAGGVGTFSATLATLGIQTLSATDTVSATISGSTIITVFGELPSHFAILAPSAATAGAAITFTVIAETAANTPDAVYTGTVLFSSSDSAASFAPASARLVNGTGIFSVTLRTAGSQTLIVTDASVSVLTGVNGPITVNAAPASHFIVSAPAATTAGHNISFTVTAEDPFNNLATGYAGTVAFSSSDRGVVFSQTSSTVAAGVGVFSATLTTAGSQTLTATDTTSASVFGFSNPVLVSASTATHLVVTAPRSVPFLLTFAFTVTAEDQFNNTATSYTGTVQFSTSDTGVGAGVPAPSTLAGGVGSFSATLASVFSNQTLSAVDTVSAAISGAATIQVLENNLSFALAAPNFATAGRAITFTVTAENTSNQTATNYTGTVVFTSSDSHAILPASTTLTNGVGVFSVTLETAGSQSLVATDSRIPSLTGQTTVAVSPSVATHFAVNTPASATAGARFNFTVTAEDQFNNTANGYTGIVHFTSTDVGGATVLPANSTLAGGVGTLSATLTTSGTQTIIATDTVNTTLTGSSPTMTVIALGDHFVLTGVPSGVSAGANFVFTLTAENASNTTDTSYTGTVQFSSTDSKGILPANTTLVNGQGIFSATLETAGSRKLTAADTVGTTIVAATATITVTAAAANHFVVTAPGAATAGIGVPFTVTAEDQFNNIATTYSGIVHFSSTDTGASTLLPANSPLTAGVGTFSATLTTAGSQTLTATDSSLASVFGASNPINASAAAATHFAVAAPPITTASNTISFTVFAEDPFNNLATSYAGTVAFSSSDSGAVFSQTSSTLAAGVGIFSVAFKTPGSQTLTASDTATSTLSGTSNTITVGAVHFILETPATATAGIASSFTVVAEDVFNNLASSFAGTAIFSSSDSAAVFAPASSILTSGVGVFTVTLKTAGRQTLTVTDTLASAVAGVSGPITVNAAAATHLVVSAPATTTAGSSIAFTVSAEDPFNNLATSYAGKVALTSSDSRAVFSQTSGTLTAGIGVFSVALETAGSQTLTASDTVTSSLSATSNPITVVAAPAAHFVVEAPSSATAGTAFSITVVAEDAFNNLAIGYTGTVVLSSSDTNAVFLPALSTLTGGTGSFSVALTKVGAQTVKAADSLASSVSGTSSPIVVSAGAVTHFANSGVPSTVTAGNSFSFTVTADDQFNNTVTGYNGTVSFSSSDSQATLPGSGTLAGGVGTFSATLITEGSQTIFEQGTSVAPGFVQQDSSFTVNVTAAATNRLTITEALPFYPGVISGPTMFASTGVPLQFTVTAVDVFGNIVPTYAGTVQLTSSDTNAFLPATAVVTKGIGTFTGTLETPGSQTLTATDLVSGLSAMTSPIATRGLVVTGLTLTAGGFVVTFNRPVNTSAVSMYTTGSIPDNVMLATTITQVSVRGTLLFDSSGDSMTFVKTEPISSAGTFNPASGLLAPGKYTLTLRSYFSVALPGNSQTQAGFQDLLGDALDGANSGVSNNNFVFTFSVTAPPVAVGIPDFARGPSNTNAVFLPSTLTNGSTFALSYTNPAATPTTGTAIITFSTNGATLATNIQTALTSGGLAAQIGVNSSANNTPNSVVVVTNDVSSGANVLVTFQSALAQATGELLTSTTAGVSISAALINVANNIPGNGIPIALSSGLNVTSGTFTLQYNPSLLTISGAVQKIAGTTFTLVSNDTANGIAVLSFSSPSSISSNTRPITLGSLLATVPMSATSSYGAQQLLHFSSEQLNGIAGPIPMTNADGVEVAAYFGDVTDTGGPLSLKDASAIMAVAHAIPNPMTQTLPGFAAFPNLDPAIIGDVSLEGFVTSTDAGAVMQEVGGLARVTIPVAPIGLTVTPPAPVLAVHITKAAVEAGGGTVHAVPAAAALSTNAIAPNSVVQSQSVDIGHRTSDFGPALLAGPAFGNSASAVQNLVVSQTLETSTPPWLGDFELAPLAPTTGSGLLAAPIDSPQVQSPDANDPLAKDG